MLQTVNEPLTGDYSLASGMELWGYGSRDEQNTNYIVKTLRENAAKCKFKVY